MLFGRMVLLSGLETLVPIFFFLSMSVLIYFLNFWLILILKMSVLVSDSGGLESTGMIVMEEIDLPVAGKQVPDVFIYLSLEGNALPYCFARIKSSDLLAAKFKGPPIWVVFQEEKNINGLDTGVYPGQLLIKLGLGSEEAMLDSKDEWDDAMDSVVNVQPFLCRFHLYQCRDLPSADSNGLCDPFLRIKFNGNMQESKHVEKTLYPTYYQTFDFHCDLSPDKEFMPMVRIFIHSLTLPHTYIIHSLTYLPTYLPTYLLTCLLILLVLICFYVIVFRLPYSCTMKTSVVPLNT